MSSTSKNTLTRRSWKKSELKKKCTKNCGSNSLAITREKSMTGKNRQPTYMGYAFESYCSSSTLNPSEDNARLPNGWSGDVDTNVQWCSVVKTKLGDHRLLIGGEVDCVRGRFDGSVFTAG